MVKNTGSGRRVGAVKSRSEFKRGNTWFNLMPGPAAS